MFTCPVCGYNQLQYPPENFTICPSCYTEFGYEDATGNYQALTQAWIQNGLQWAAANVMPPPPGWSPYEQLKNLGGVVTGTMALTENSRAGIGVVELGERVTIVENEPRVAVQGHWLLVGNLVEGVQVVADA